VFYRASSPEFAAAYDDLRRAYPWVRFENESSFNTDVRRIVRGIGSRYLCFGVDDAVFVRPVNADTVLSVMDDAQVLAFSLRLGKNLASLRRLGICVGIVRYGVSHVDCTVDH
jgi:hypothetical protein